MEFPNTKCPLAVILLCVTKFAGVASKLPLKTNDPDISESPLLLPVVLKLLILLPRNLIGTIYLLHVLVTLMMVKVEIQKYLRAL